MGCGNDLTGTSYSVGGAIMISGKFRLKNYDDWQITYFLLTDRHDTDEVLEALHKAGCSEKLMRQAERLFNSKRKNIGLAYSRKSKRKSVLVVSKTTSTAEFINSFAHEIDHLEKHIAKTLGFSPYSESASYLVGEMTRGIFNNITK